MDTLFFIGLKCTSDVRFLKFKYNRNSLILTHIFLNYPFIGILMSCGMKGHTKFLEIYFVLRKTARWKMKWAASPQVLLKNEAGTQQKKKALR